MTRTWADVPVIVEQGTDGQWYAVLRDAVVDGQLLPGAVGESRRAALASLIAQCEVAAPQGPGAPA